MKNFLNTFPFRKVSIFLTIVGSFTYNLFLDGDVSCNCKQKTRDCAVYMCLPGAIIFFLVLWTDNEFQRAWSYTCSQLCSKLKVAAGAAGGAAGGRYMFCGVLLTSVLKAFLIGLLWVISLLVDGDWYVCCKMNSTELQSQLACKDKNNFTAEEQASFVELKNESRTCGFSVLLTVLGLSALLTSIDWLKCCGEGSWCCNRRVLYYQKILKERENVMKDVLEEAAKDELKGIFIEKIHEGKLEECFDVTDEIIKKSGNPKLSKDQQRVRHERNEENS